MELPFKSKLDTHYVYHDESLQQTYQKMIATEKDYIFVVEKNKQPIGIVTLYDILLENNRDEKCISDMAMNIDDVHMMNENEIWNNTEIKKHKYVGVVQENGAFIGSFKNNRFDLLHKITEQSHTITFQQNLLNAILTNIYEGIVVVDKIGE